MNRKATSIWLSALLIGTLFTVVLMGNVGAMVDEQNLSGLVWRADGTAPSTTTNFCIWVERGPGGTWYRFPDAPIWAKTEMDIYGNSWYSYVLPDQYYGSRWADTDRYRVQVDGTPWDNFNGNCTSNATNPPPSGDPDPTDPGYIYDPMNENNSYNILNFAAGGGFSNDQQWDVRTVAPLDLAPTNITAYGLRAEDYPLGIPVPQDSNIYIYFNVTNFGLIDSGPFQILVSNCTLAGVNDPPPYLADYPHGTLLPGEDTLEPYVIWHSPNLVGDFYVNITVDSAYALAEYNEVNNTFILHFIMGSDLVPDNVQVDGLLPTDPIYRGPDEGVVITSWVKNIGFSPTIGGEIIGAYYGATNLDQFTISPLNPGESTGPFTWNWNLPWDTGDYYIDIIVDVNDDLVEANEANNMYTLHFFVGPDLTYDNVTVNGADGTGIVVINPDITYDIGVVGKNNNIAPSSTGNATFRITFEECDEFGNPIGPIFFESGDLPLTTLQPGDATLEQVGQWHSPIFNGTLNFYIKITIDYYNTTSETDESNNVFIVQLMMDAPDLTPFEINVWVEGAIYATFDTFPPWFSPLVEVPRDSDVTIEVIVTNIGGVESGETNVTFYNLSGVGGPPIDDPFDEQTLFNVTPLGTRTVSGLWPSPHRNDTFYINISIDFNGTDINGRVLELNEYNNYFTLVINTTANPITSFIPRQPHVYDRDTGLFPVYYITSNTEINLTAGSGTPPLYTWYRILWASNSTQILGWTDYTGSDFFKVPYGEFASYKIEFYTIDSVGALEVTKSHHVIVDDSPPDTFISVGTPRHRASGNDNWNVTKDTTITLSATDNRQGSDPTLFISRAAGIDASNKPQSGIFYRIFMQGNPAPFVDWTEGIQFKLDNTSWLDGKYIIEYNSTDNLGNKELTKSITVYLDNNGPSTNIAVGYPKYQDVPIPGFVKPGTPYTLSGDDGPGCGVNDTTFMFRIVNLTSGIGTPWANDDSFTIGGGFPTYGGDGNFSIRYYCTDWLGNSGVQGIITVYVDTTAPFVTLVVEEPRFRANSTDMWNITDTTNFGLTGATDGAGCGLKIIEYRISNATQNWGWQTYEAIPLTFGGFEDGEYTIEYRITDFLDNSRTMSENVVLDSTPPTTVIVIGDPKYPDVPILNVTSVTPISFTIDDGVGTGVNSTEYEIITSTGQQVVDPTPYTANFTLDGLADGEYDIIYHSEDLLGNIEELNIYRLVVDNTGPTVDITGGQTDWNPDESAWNVDFDTFFRLQADDGDGSGVDIIEWRIRIDDTTWTPWQTYTAQFNLTLQEHGYWDHTIEFRATDKLGNIGPTGSLEIYIEGDITPPDPPVLRLYVQGDDILLDWNPSPDPDVHHYLIYRSATKTGFDFSTHWINTEDDTDVTNTPLRTQWNDTGAVSGSPEFFYAIRGVDGRDNIGSPSNIAGKVTMTFTSGYNTFALPLEPFEDMTAAGMLSHDVFADNTDTIYIYDTETEQWTGRPKFMPSELNDFGLEMGEGYMLNVKETTLQYTFTGAAATSLRYRGGVGDEDTFRNSLDVSASGSSVELSWEAATDATGYAIYRGTTRIGTGSLTDFSLTPLVEVSGSTLTYTDNTASEDEYYYMVVAQAGGADSSGTYAVGVRTISLPEGYTPMSLELEPIIDDPSLSYYVNDIFSQDSSTLYYYDGNSAVWQGHPGFMPENMNNPDVGTGTAYLAFVYGQGESYTFTGI